MLLRNASRIVPFLLVLVGCSTTPSMPEGDYLGLLRFPSITYHIYLDWNSPTPRVLNTTFKANEYELDTLYFKNDSLHFRLKEFYSEYKGRFDKTTNSILGQWIGEDSTTYPLTFLPALADTISGLHPRTTKYAYQTPPMKEDGILSCELTNQAINPIPLDSLMQHIIQGKYTNIHSLLIARNNCLVMEEYFYRFDRDFVYNIQSATKSVVSALTGIALGRNEIESVNETVCELLPKYKSLACNDINKGITLHHLLTMSTGIAWDEQTYDYMDERNSASIAASNKDQFVHLLSLPHVTSTTPVFAYNSLNHLLMNAVLRETTQLENSDELTGRLLKPLGIENTYIGETTPMGVIGDIGLRPRDMLKFGLLYLNNGVWEDKQIVPSDWVKESTLPKIFPRPNLGYGYFWWTKDFAWKAKTVSSFFAWGYGGQYIFVIPELKIVIVLSGSQWSTDPEGQAMEMVEEILSAIE